jgi:glycosyltransferase involved in cell wall biosynthesis
MPKVAFVTNFIPIYRFPVYRMLNRLGGFDFEIFTSMPLALSCREALASLPIKYSASLNIPRGTRHRVSGGRQRELVSLPLGLIRDLIAYRPDVIVAGELGIRSFVCWCAAKILGSKFVLSSEEISTSAMGRSKLQLRLRRFLVRRADAFLAWGVPAQEYLLSLNIPASRVSTCAQAVDNEYWIGLAKLLDRKTERSALGFEGTVFLLVGRAVQRKGFQNFIAAWSRLSAHHHSRACAVIVGDGDYLPDLKRLTADLGLTNIRFVGIKAARELARYYYAADIFVFPSLEDVWGLVVNEAVCFELPILASRYAGASQSFLVDSNLGLLFDPADIHQFEQNLRMWIDSPPARAPEACRRALRDLTFEESCRAIRQMMVAVTVESHD